VPAGSEDQPLGQECKQPTPVRAQAAAPQDAFNRIDSTSSMEETASTQLFAVLRHDQSTTFAVRSEAHLVRVSGPIPTSYP